MAGFLHRSSYWLQKIFGYGDYRLRIQLQWIYLFYDFPPQNLLWVEMEDERNSVHVESSTYFVTFEQYSIIHDYIIWYPKK